MKVLFKKLLKPWKWVKLASLTGLTALGLVLGNLGDDGRLESAIAQPPSPPLQILAQNRIRPNEVWRLVYQRLPDLPRENQYINQKSGQVDENNTLISRLIRYHTVIKSRPPGYRLDWKLTLADYLDLNEIITEGVYPGFETLRQNPLEGDKAAIRRLTRTQRDALVDTLVSIYSPNTPRPRVTNPVAPRTSPSRPPQPRPGDAQLLAP